MTEASVTVSTGRLTVAYDPQQVSEAAIRERIKSLGYTLADPKSSAPFERYDHHYPHADGHSHKEDHAHHEHDEAEEHDHGHGHGAGEFNLKQELPPVLMANYYTPIVVFLSLGVALLPSLLIPGADRFDWVYRALVLLGISCPCGLVMSIPLGYFGGIGAVFQNDRCG